MAASYLLSLCDLTQTSNLSFGVASRLHTQTSTFKVETSRLIHDIVTFSPASESVALEFLHEFEKVSYLQDLVRSVTRLQSDFQPEEWAQEVVALLRNRETETLEVDLKPVTDLATEYLNHLLIATRNPGGKKTPQVSTPPTPDIHRLQTVQELLVNAIINTEQGPLKELIARRDGYTCLFTGFPFQRETKPGEISRTVVSRCAHIIPFSFHDKPVTCRFLESFAGSRIVAEDARARINDPRNAITLQSDARDDFDKLAWGIEAQQQAGGEWKYLYRLVGNQLPGTISLEDGDEIRFCHGEDGRLIDPPDPLFCNTRLAIARVMHACGASGLINELYGDEYDDDEAIVTQPVYLGGPFVSDDVLLRRVHDRLPVSWSGSFSSESSMDPDEPTQIRK